MATSNELLRNILDTMFVGVYFVDTERRITYWNKGAERLTGFSADEVLGSRCMDNILCHVDGSGRQLCLEGCPLMATMEDGRSREAEVYFHHKRGHRVPTLVRVTPLRDETGAIVGGVEVFSDFSRAHEDRRHARQMEQLALRDPLTGLSNRRHTEMRLRQKLEEAAESGQPFGVLFLDLDHFKLVNDRYGHETGDAALSLVARTLAESARADDVVGRWGGEEFVVLTTPVGTEELAAIAGRIRAMVERSVLRSGAATISVTVSIGATLARPGETAGECLARADALTYRSKEAGRNRVTVG